MADTTRIRSMPRTAFLAATALAASLLVAAPATALSPVGVPGRGATVPFVEQEAEDAAHNGTVIGPDRVYGRLPAEASGRRAVTLDAVGEYVEFTLTEPANAVVVRYSVPDSPTGTGRDAPADLRINGNKVADLRFTSRYGWYYGGYPFNNNPGDTNPHHFYDEVRAFFGSTQPAGARIRVQVASTSASPTFTIDLADFELVAAPTARPAGSLSVVDFGADPSGGGDATAAFQAAVDAGRAQGREVWIPVGNFTLYDHVIVDQVTLRGAGPWYSVLGGRHPNQRSRAAGIYGKYANQGGSRNVTLKDFAIIGEITERVDEDQVNAIGGAMSDSVVDNVWMQHTKCGAWMDGPMNNFTIRNSRILDQTADGVNFHYGVTNSTVENTFVRNTGDDGLAMWAENVPNVNNTFRSNTVGVTLLANNIAIYGGRDINVTDNVVADTVTNGGGIHVGNRYPGVNSGNGTAVSGTFTLARNTLIRAGNSDFNWNFGVGAIWFNALNEPMTGATINVTDTDILDSSYAAIHFIEGRTTGVRFDNVRIDRTGTYALQIQSPGQASFTNVRATGIAQGNPIHNCVGPSFEISQGAGNSGWYTAQPFCGPWPAPVWNTEPSGALAANPASVSFAPQRLGTASTATRVTVTNIGSAPVSLHSVTADGDFAQTNTCGSQLAPDASCTADVTFRPTATGTRSGTLSIASSAPGSPLTVALTGTGVNPSANLALGRPATATSHTDVYGAGNSVDGNPNSYWESANHAFPQSLTVDLGAVTSVSKVVLKLPPAAAWAARTQTLSVLGSTDGSAFTTIKPSAGYRFDPASGNTVTIAFAATSQRHLRLTFTGNTGWPAGQTSELEVYAA